MLKKFLLATLLVLSTHLVFASGAPYVGASIGITANTAQSITVKTIGDSSFRGIPINIFAGYGGILNGNFYLGGEVTGTLLTADLNDNGLKTSYGYGVSLIPGFMLCDHTLAYGRLGLLNARFPHQRDSRSGGQLGLGLQTGLTQNVDIRGEYDFIAYRSVSDWRNGGAVSPRSDQVNVSVVYKFD